MKKRVPGIDLRPTAQNVQDRRRTELLLEIEEEGEKAPERLRRVIDACPDREQMQFILDKINVEYAGGRLSDKLLKRCGTWVQRRLEEWRVHKQTH